MSCAVWDDGNVSCWGRFTPPEPNGSGGTGLMRSSHVPRDIAGVTDVMKHIDIEEDIQGASCAHMPLRDEVLARWISNLHDERPSLQVIVDPVIGDHDHGVYVDPGIIEAYRRHLLPLAHGLTPNGFELERLTGQPTGDIGSVIAAARMLLTGRTQWVTVTSATPIALSPAEMQVAVVTRDETRVLKHPRIATSPKGTGDLFAAALTGHLLEGASIFEAAAQACNHVVIALKHTHRARCAELLLPPVGRASCSG